MRWCCEWDDDVDEMRWDGGSKKHPTITVHRILRWDDDWMRWDQDPRTPKHALN